MIIKSALASARNLLSESESPQIDAEILLAFVLGKPREHLYTWPENELTEAQLQQFQKFCQRRLKGHPIAYLVGKRAFWDFDLTVNSTVLIPRPETELLVELCLEKAGLSEEVTRVADLGTGSGAIALSLASERPHWNILASDISSEALAVAKFNAEALGLDNLQFKLGAWCEAFTESEFDIIVSNPPYIDSEDEHLQQGDVRFEPALALISAKNGLADITCIAEQALSKLKVGGCLFFEHGFEQGEAVRSLLLKLGYFEVRTFQDISGNDRVTCGKKKEALGHE